MQPRLNSTAFGIWSSSFELSLCVDCRRPNKRSASTFTKRSGQPLSARSHFPGDGIGRHVHFVWAQSLRPRACWDRQSALSLSFPCWLEARREWFAARGEWHVSEEWKCDLNPIRALATTLGKLWAHGCSSKGPGRMAKHMDRAKVLVSAPRAENRDWAARDFLFIARVTRRVESQPGTNERGMFRCSESIGCEWPMLGSPKCQVACGPKGESLSAWSCWIAKRKRRRTSSRKSTTVRGLLWDKSRQPGAHYLYEPQWISLWWVANAEGPSGTLFVVRLIVSV